MLLSFMIINNKHTNEIALKLEELNVENKMDSLDISVDFSEIVSESESIDPSEISNPKITPNHSEHEIINMGL